MHVYLMIFAVFVLIFRCWTFCFSFDFIKVLVLSCIYLCLLVSFTSSLFIYTWRREQQNEEGIRGRAPTVRSTVPHGCASKLFVHVIVWTVMNTYTVVAVIINNNANSNTVVTPICGVYSSCIRIKAINFNALFHVVT